MAAVLRNLHRMLLGVLMLAGVIACPDASAYRPETRAPDFFATLAEAHPRDDAGNQLASGQNDLFAYETASGATLASESAMAAPKVVWPPNNGFAEMGQASILPGTRIDRFGGLSGFYAAPEGTPFAMRSLPQSSLNSPYNVFEVLKPIETNVGPAAPWFGQPGNGLQYQFSSSFEEMIQSGHMRVVPPPGS